MFARKVDKLQEILNCCDGEVFKKIEQEELYYACREDYISIYYEGNVLAEIHPQSVTLSDAMKKRLPDLWGNMKMRNGQKKISDYFLQYSNTIKTEIDNTPFNDKQIERRNEMLLGKKYGFNENTVVIDVETKIPEDEGIINEETKEPKHPEVDMVIFDSRKKILYLTEYKCNDKSMGNIKEHYTDMLQVIEKCKDHVVKGEIDVYNMRSGRLVDHEDVEVKIALCFSDLKKSDILKALKDVRGKEMYIWYGEELKDIDLERDPELLDNFATKDIK